MDSTPVLELEQHGAPVCSAIEGSSHVPVQNGSSHEDNGNGLLLEEQKPVTVSKQDQDVLGSFGKGDQALQDVGNTVSVTPASRLPKKSLLKRPKSETSIIVDNPPKRIRIVEDLETINRKIDKKIDDEDVQEMLVGVDDMAAVTEVITCGESVKWLKSSCSAIDQESVNVEFVRDSLAPVKRTFSVEIDMRFILSETCTAMLASKTIIADVGTSNFDVWITQCYMRNKNLGNVVHKENFLKMANIDALLNNDLTAPPELTECVATKETESIYYVGDLWHNSKGFREYILWKTAQKEKDFSTKIITLRATGPINYHANVEQKTGYLFTEPNVSSDDVDLAYLPTEQVEAYGSSAEYHNILNADKIDNFTEFVHSRTDGKGLHTFIADNVEVSNAYESCRETRFQKYFYCECLLALRCLREGGTFVCKMFDSITLFTNGLLFLLYKCFKQIAIHKPSTSPPYTSERYVICKGKIDNLDTKYIIDFLSDCLDMVVNNQEQRKIIRRKVRKRLQVLKMEVQALVPLRLILSHAEFFQFVRDRNIRLAAKLAESIDELCQAFQEKDKKSLQKLAEHINQTHQKVLAISNAPVYPLIDKQSAEDPSKQAEQLIAKYGFPSGLGIIKEFNMEKDKIVSPHEFFAFPVQYYSTGDVFKSRQCWFFGCGKSGILYLDDNKWRPLAYSEFSLPHQTLAFGEIVEELTDTDKARKYIRCLHLIDVVCLHGTYVGSMSFHKRQMLLKRVIRTSTNRANKNIFVTQPLNLNDMIDFYTSAQTLELMGYRRTLWHLKRLETGSTSGNSILVNGFLVYSTVQECSTHDFFKRSLGYKVAWDSDKEKMMNYLSNFAAV